jgi:hypothetical protein
MIPVMGGEYRWRSPQAIAGLSACALMLGCGRWGAHLGVPPVYISDVLLAVAFVHTGISWVFVGPRPNSGAAKRRYPGPGVSVLLGWAILRFGVGGDYGVDALRDVAPYAYGAVAFLAANGYAASTPDDRARTRKIIEVALLWHLLWVIASLLVYGTAATTAANPDLGLLLVRADVDGSLLGVTACLYLLRYLHQGGLRRLLVAGAALGGMFTMTSRAAALATLVGLGLTLCFYATSKTTHRRRIAMAGVLPIALVVFTAVVPQTTAGSKLATSVGLVEADSRIDLGGLGTQRARSNAWQRVIAYARQTPSRELAGVGFGPNFMIDSGGSVALLSGNAPDVRAPHNYLIGTYARLGLVGLLLLGLVVVQLLAGIWRVRRLAGSDDLVFLAAIVPPMILAAAIFGVVLEAPFGAIPFFWFLGILFAKPEPTPSDTAVELALTVTSAWFPRNSPAPTP